MTTLSTVVKVDGIVVVVGVCVCVESLIVCHDENAAALRVGERVWPRVCPYRPAGFSFIYIHIKIGRCIYK